MSGEASVRAEHAGESGALTDDCDQRLSHRAGRYDKLLPTGPLPGDAVELDGDDRQTHAPPLSVSDEKPRRASSFRIAGSRNNSINARTADRSRRTCGMIKS